MEGYEKAFEEHQEKSRAGSEQKFACGLADHKEETTCLHTATHLLHAALKKVCSEDIEQRGSNITEERLRFDFNFPRKLTPEEVAEVERLVNEQIEMDVPVVMEEMPLSEAKARGFIGLFESKYGERVKTYSIGDFSREICGGPHASSTGQLGRFKIVKQEYVSAGVKRGLSSRERKPTRGLRRQSADIIRESVLGFYVGNLSSRTPRALSPGAFDTRIYPTTCHKAVFLQCRDFYLPFFFFLSANLTTKGIFEIL